MFRTRSVIIALACLVLVSSWVVHPLIMAGEDQNDWPQSLEGARPPQAGTDGTIDGHETHTLDGL